MKPGTRFIRQRGPKKPSQYTDSPRQLVPNGTAAEVGKVLRDTIRTIDVRIIGATKGWDNYLKRSLVEARMAVGSSPREEANALNGLVACLGLHMIEPDRWKYRTWHPEVTEALHAAREILGLPRDDRFDVDPR